MRGGIQAVRVTGDSGAIGISAATGPGRHLPGEPKTRIEGHYSHNFTHWAVPVAGAVTHCFLDKGMRLRPTLTLRLLDQPDPSFTPPESMPQTARQLAQVLLPNDGHWRIPGPAKQGLSGLGRPRPRRQGRGRISPSQTADGPR